MFVRALGCAVVPALLIMLVLALVLPILLNGTAGSVTAAPVDAKVGQTRLTFSKRGVALRAKASSLGAAVATLPYGTRMKVLERSKSWLRVRTVAAGSRKAQTGWLRAWETVEPSALNKNPKPPHLTSSGSTGTSASEVSAAGRQLDAGTERRFRTTRKGLERAYRLVDAMEAATAALHPADALTFIDDGSLGRAGRDFTRPGRVAASPRKVSKPRGGTTGGGLLGKLGGEAARRLGAGSKGQRVTESVIESASDYAAQVKLKFTPQQEYYLGRAVAAKAIAQYGVDKDAGRRRYVRLVGEALVRLSSRIPANFGGYHFEVLDSDEVNGISGPGGFVLLTRGAVQACRNEAELAGVLAHELAHITKQHGEKLIRQSREFPSFVKGLARVGGAVTGSSFAQGLTRFFGQVADKMSGTAINHGYGRSLEFAADKEGTWLLFDVWYDHVGLQSLLRRLGGDSHRHVRGATHASPQARAQALVPVIGALKPFQARSALVEARDKRFRTSLNRAAAQPK